MQMEATSLNGYEGCWRSCNFEYPVLMSLYGFEEKAQEHDIMMAWAAFCTGWIGF